VRCSCAGASIDSLTTGQPPAAPSPAPAGADAAPAPAPLTTADARSSSAPLSTIPVRPDGGSGGGGGGGGGGLPAGAIAGIVVGVLAALALAGAPAWPCAVVHFECVAPLSCSRGHLASSVHPIF
jgi:hypothetical protein